MCFIDWTQLCVRSHSSEAVHMVGRTLIVIYTVFHATHKDTVPKRILTARQPREIKLLGIYVTDWHKQQYQGRSSKAKWELEREQRPNSRIFIFEKLCSFIPFYLKNKTRNVSHTIYQLDRSRRHVSYTSLWTPSYSPVGCSLFIYSGKESCQVPLGALWIHFARDLCSLPKGSHNKAGTHTLNGAQSMEFLNYCVKYKIPSNPCFWRVLIFPTCPILQFCSKRELKPPEYRSREQWLTSGANPQHRSHLINFRFWNRFWTTAALRVFGNSHTYFLPSFVLIEIMIFSLNNPLKTSDGNTYPTYSSFNFIEKKTWV